MVLLFADIYLGVEFLGHMVVLKIELPYDPAIPLLDIYPEKTITQKDTCTPIFITALFTIARSWKQIGRASCRERV